MLTSEMPHGGLGDCTAVRHVMMNLA